MSWCRGRPPWWLPILPLVITVVVLVAPTTGAPTTEDCRQWDWGGWAQVPLSTLGLGGVGDDALPAPGLRGLWQVRLPELRYSGRL